MDVKEEYWIQCQEGLQLSNVPLLKLELLSWGMHVRKIHARVQTNTDIIEILLKLSVRPDKCTKKELENTRKGCSICRKATESFVMKSLVFKTIREFQDGFEMDIMYWNKKLALGMESSHFQKADNSSLHCRARQTLKSAEVDDQKRAVYHYCGE